MALRDIFQSALNITGGRSPAQALETLKLLATNEAFRKSTMGQALNPQEVQQLAQTRTATGVENAPINTQGIVRQVGADALKQSAFAVPFGRGAGIASKALIPGGQVGALQSLANTAETGQFSPVSLAKGIAGGAAGAGVLSKAGGLVPKAGQKLADVGENLAIRRLRPSPSQQRKFMRNTGEQLTDVIKKFNLQGAGVDEIANTIQPLQQKFDDIAMSKKLEVDPQTVISGFSDEISRLQNSITPADKNKAQTLSQIAENFIERSGNNKITAQALTQLRREIDESVKDFAADPIVASTNRLTRDIFQNAIRQAADKAGMKAGKKTLKELGQDLSKLYGLQEIAESQQFLGQGSLPLNLTRLLGGVGGGSIAGIPGALGGAVLAGLGNSPRAISAASRAATGIGGRLSEASLPQAALNIASRSVPELIKPGDNRNKQPEDGSSNQSFQHFDALLGANVSSIPQGSDTSGLPSFSSVGGNQMEQGKQLSPGGEWMWDEQAGDWVPNPDMAGGMGGGSVQEQLRMAALQDLATTGGQNISKIAAVLSLFPEETAEPLQLSDTAIRTVTDLQSGLTDIQGLREVISSSEDVGPLTGLVASKNPFDVDAQTLQSEIDRVRQTVGKALEGGVLRKEDEEKYRKILPTMTDKKEVALNKIDKLEQKLTEDITRYIETQKQAGKGRSQPPAGLENVDPNILNMIQT